MEGIFFFGNIILFYLLSDMEGFLFYVGMRKGKVCGVGLGYSANIFLFDLYNLIDFMV